MTTQAEAAVQPDYLLGSCRMQDGQPVFEGKVSISEEDWKHYEQAISRLMALTERRTLKMVARNAQQLDTLRGYYETLYQSRRTRERGRIDAREAADNLMSAVMSWLSSFRLYLDHEETRIKRTYGKESQQAARYKSSTNAAYDRSSAYRIIYKFRNYVQHCGLPISRVSQSAVDDGGPVNQQIKFTIDRDVLLDDFEWGSALADVRDLADDVDIFGLIDQTMEALQEVAHEVLRIDTEAALAGLAEVREARTRLGEVDGSPILLKLGIESDSVRELSHIPILDERDIERLERAAQQDDPLQSLLTAPPLPPIPPALPASTRYRIGRALDLFAKWSDEGGASANYHQHANAIITEDGSVEPVLTGMVFLTSFALAMAAGALGTSPQDILGGLTREPGAEETAVD